MSRPDPIPDRARDLFDRASERLDQGTAFRLRRAREAALRPAPAALPGRRLWPAGAVAASVMALGLAWWIPGTGPDSPAAPLASEEIESLVLAEDAELYAWLADAPVASRGEPR